MSQTRTGQIIVTNVVDGARKSAPKKCAVDSGHDEFPPNHDTRRSEEPNSEGKRLTSDAPFFFGTDAKICQMGTDPSKLRLLPPVTHSHWALRPISHSRLGGTPLPSSVSICPRKFIGASFNGTTKLCIAPYSSVKTRQSLGLPTYTPNRQKVVQHKRRCVAEKIHKCNECEMAFRGASDLIRHRRIHTGEKPFECSECNRRFAYRNNLKVHKRKHTGEKPFKCDECGERFAQSGNLVAHRRMHTGEKPYKCDECHRNFAQRSHLNRHRRQHNGDKPFKCECGQLFAQSGNLVAHRRVHTGEKPADMMLFQIICKAGSRPIFSSACDTT